MMIHCTKKLLNELKINMLPDSDEISIFSWHANLITINRRKTVVLANDKTRYAVVMYGLNSKDFKNFAKRIQNAIRETFLSESIRPEIIDQYLNSTSNIYFSKTGSRSSISRMNKACELVHIYASYELFDNENITQSDASNFANDDLVGYLNDYFHPNIFMIDELTRLHGSNILNNN